VSAQLRPNANRRAVRTSTPQLLDGLALAVVLVALLGVTAVSIATSPIWQPGAPPEAPWCLPGQTPAFSFGFAELSQQLGSIMGQPTECEHGDGATDDTIQQTTTGLAVYRWCNNTPTFSREQEHWMLMPGGAAYWTGQDIPPRPPPIVRMPDLRHPCPP
jgi:hypothetical protein